MENKKSKPAASKSHARRTVSNPATKPTSLQGSVKQSSNQQQSTAHSKKAVAAAQKQGVAVSRPTSKVEKDELEKLDQITIPNTSFTVLVRVVVAASKWIKIIKESTAKPPLSKSLSLPPAPLRPV